MNLEMHRACVAALRYGKRLPGAVYVLRPDPSDVPGELWKTICRAETAARPDPTWNLLKVHTEQFALTFLSYPDFDCDPHLALAEATKINVGTGSVVRTDYRARVNPPILHRKETFLPEGDPRFAIYAALTKREREDTFEQYHAFLHRIEAALGALGGILVVYQPLDLLTERISPCGKLLEFAVDATQFGYEFVALELELVAGVFELVDFLVFFASELLMNVLKRLTDDDEFLADLQALPIRFLKVFASAMEDAFDDADGVVEGADCVVEMLIACDGEQLLDGFTLLGAFRQVTLADAPAAFQWFDSLIADRTANFVGRKDALNQLTAFAAGGPKRVLVVIGSPGQGKTSLLASWTQSVLPLRHFLRETDAANCESAAESSHSGAGGWLEHGLMRVRAAECRAAV